MAKTVLIVEDEQDLLNTLDYNLQREGYQTRLAKNGAEALAAAKESPTPDVVLLDLMLPDISGTEVCRTLREQDSTRNVPIIMVTARGEEIDRVVGFEVGADDYVLKPFSVRELALRIRAVLRRAKPSSPPPPNDKIEWGLLSVDIGAHRCLVDGKEVALTALEFKLLVTLYKRRGRVQSREVLLTDVWGLSSATATRTVDTHVKRLRQKLNEAGAYIVTMRGVGYRFQSELDSTNG